MTTKKLNQNTNQLDFSMIHKIDFSLYFNKIEYIFSEITKKSNFNSCETWFNELNEIQLELAKYAFKYNVKIPLKLMQFIKDFDRIDDDDYRLSIYKKIKSENMIDFYTE